MNTKLYLGFLATSLLSVALLQGCGSDTTGTGGSTTSTTATGDTSSTSSGTGGASANPPAPKLGTQMDRFGRPAINTALNHSFDGVPASAGAAKDAYNQDSDTAKWSANVPEFAKNLAVLDALDGKCGNQLLASATLDAKRYGGLAGALADDRLYLDTSAATCTTYLAVEANATGIQANTDCGGRKLNFDVIDVSYSVLAAGALTGVSDGVPPDADVNGTTFPYLAAPH